MHDKKFNPKKLGMLNDPQRLKAIPPEYIWKKLDLEDCNVIADIGAGTGLFTKAFLSLAGKGTAYAADISPEMIHWMTENLKADKGRIVPLLMEESRINLAEGSVDLVLMFNLYHELEDPDALLREAKRILKTGGKICIVDWKKEKTDFGPPLEHRVSAQDIARDLELAGFGAVQSDGTMVQHSFVWGKK